MSGLTNDSSIHYVKFIRGSIQAWENLNLTPNKIDDDCLYFIYASAENTREGKLYLGQKLISGVGSGTATINIADIGDIYIDGSSLADKQILVYNETNEQWENTSLSTIIHTAVGVMQGATAQANGQAGLVPSPQAGDQNKFLKGDGSWGLINVPSFNNYIFDVVNNTVTLQGYNMATVGSVPIKTNNGIEWSNMPTGTLKRQITTLEKLQAQLDGTDPDPLDTETIYMVPNNTNTNNKYDEYMIIGNALELLGTFGHVDLNDYVTVTTFNTRVGTIENILQDTVDANTGDTIPGLVSRVTTIEANYVTKDKIGDLNALILSGNNTTLVEEVNTISDRLKWHDLT